ncbi:hypothetical protein [Psychromonas sp. psych-6C06]|uniref:hypothetical protein n=1 Tax=Psychromonas sp. psych-6C06 TaxID=2058089 RepID=UPI00187BD698|nr:hypothetical protein [Psychromonas sp. psych-6C06]
MHLIKAVFSHTTTVTTGLQRLLMLINGQQLSHFSIPLFFIKENPFLRISITHSK